MGIRYLTQQLALIPIRPLGSHEDGHGGGCCGCIIEQLSGELFFSILPGPNPCQGTIEFSGAEWCCDTYAYGEFRVTDLCGTYEDIIQVRLVFAEACGCSCPHQGDYDADGFVTALDMGALIDVLFAGAPDTADFACPPCRNPTTRGDLDCDGFATALDLSQMIDHLFAGGPGPCDPCSFRQ